jgi:hypothetical protein
MAWALSQANFAFPNGPSDPKCFGWEKIPDRRVPEELPEKQTLENAVKELGNARETTLNADRRKSQKQTELTLVNATNN